MHGIKFVSDWQATVVSVAGDRVFVGISDVAALAAATGITDLDGTTEATSYLGVPVSLFSSADAYLGMAYIIGYGGTYGSGELQLNTNAYSASLNAGGKIACRIAPEWLAHDARQRLHRSHALASGTLTLDAGALNGTVDVTGNATIEMPHSYSMVSTLSGDSMPRKFEATLWLYDSGATQPVVTIAGQNQFWIQDNIRWADGVAPSFSAGYKLLQLRLVLMGGGSTWVGTWTKHTDY